SLFRTAQHVSHAEVSLNCARPAFSPAIYLAYVCRGPLNCGIDLLTEDRPAGAAQLRPVTDKRLRARDRMSRQLVQKVARDFPESLVESAADAIIATDLDGLVVSWNGAATRLFGYTAADMLGRPIELITPLARQAEES